MAHNLLTPTECQEILAAHHFGHDSSLRNFKIVPALDAHGYLGEYYRLILCCEVLQSTKQIELHFFMKSIPQSSEEAEKTKIFEKEAKLYETLLTELQKCTTTVWCPKAFYTRSNLIVLEDLCSSGYKKCSDKTKTLTDEELKSVLKALAAFHAASIVYETRNCLKINQKYPNLLEEITVSPKIAWFTTGLRAVMDLARNHAKYQSSSTKDFIANNLETYLESVYEMQNPSTKYRNVLCHRDPWHSNVLFNSATKNAILVDYQTVRYCPPVIDVIFTLFLNLDSDCRISKESTYLQYYYKALSIELLAQKIDVQQHLSFADFLKSYDEFKLFGYLYRAIAFTLINVPGEFVTNDYKYVSRTEKLLNYMKINAEFRMEMDACIEELLEYFLNTSEVSKIK